jgi:uncharacterized protein YaaR (DUF327 family)
MDKVDFTSASLVNPFVSNTQKGTKKTGTKEESAKSGKTLFARLLESASPPPSGELGPVRELAPSEEALTELMDAVHSAGSNLIERPFAEEILQYKRAVRDFIHYVVENSYEVQTVQGLKKKVVVRGETKWKEMVYHDIHVIDKKLEELAAAILSGQTTQLQRLSKLDEIKGLLVDLTITGVIRER